MSLIVQTIQSRNVNTVFYDAWWRMKVSGVKENSRNGPVMVMPGPTITTYTHPTERVLFNPDRDANAVFHLVESLWMFAGRNSVDDLLPFNSQYGRYAEKDGRVHGAYGYRWREHFLVDQLEKVISVLRADTTTRQAVLQMWDCNVDLGHQKLNDRPCNTHIYLDGRGGSLNMTVCCRSNDILWGAYGANVVHFSMLQELVAHAVGLPVGVYHQFSNNFHAYTDLPMVKFFLGRADSFVRNPYEQVVTTPMFVGDEYYKDFIYDCEDFFEEDAFNPRTFFFKETVLPLVSSYLARKSGERIRLDDSKRDWFVAYKEWCERRDNVKS